MRITIQFYSKAWHWSLFDGPLSGDDVAFGSSTDYQKACGQAKSAWDLRITKEQ